MVIFLEGYLYARTQGLEPQAQIRVLDTLSFINVARILTVGIDDLANSTLGTYYRIILPIGWSV